MLVPSKPTSLLRVISISSAFLFGCPALARADTAIETETAQIGRHGDTGFSQSYEYAHASDGTSGGTLTQFEYGLSDRAELLIEPFFYAWEHPDGESRSQGVGDLEITPSYEFVLEDGWVPAMLGALKVKVPTGSKKVGGSGKVDYMPYIILGQHAGAWTFNANLGMNFTDEGGGSFGHTATWCLEAERELVPNLTGFIETFSTEDNVTTASAALEYDLNKHFNAFGAAGYTKEHEGVFRLGFNLGF